MENAWGTNLRKAADIILRNEEVASIVVGSLEDKVWIGLRSEMVDDIGFGDIILTKEEFSALKTWLKDRLPGREIRFLNPSRS